MSRIIRKSLPQDALDFVRIKKALSLSIDNESSSNGGFLLGTNLETYQFYIEQGNCLSAIAKNQVVGFGIILPNHLVKQSELWGKRKLANWNIDLATLEVSNLSYVEQLAFQKGHRKLAIRLAYHLVQSAFDKGANYVITTTVYQPILNLAALPYIHAAGGVLIGNIDETYPEVGRINSNIYLIEKNTFFKKVRQLSFYDLLKSSTLQ